MGTSGVKCIVINEKGAVISSCTKSYPLYTPKAGYAEQNPKDWWEGTVNAIKRNNFV